VIEAITLWNEPNCHAFWNSELDPDLATYAGMVGLAGTAIRRDFPSVTRVLGGVNPIDPQFLALMRQLGALEHVDAVGVHGYPFDWSNWRVEEWPERIFEAQEVSGLPVWVLECGISSFGSDEVQCIGLEKCATALADSASPVFWTSLYDQPWHWPAAKHSESEGSAYYRQFYLGLCTERGEPKAAFERFRRRATSFGISQGFQIGDERALNSLHLLKELQVTRVRTFVSWVDWMRPEGRAWYQCLVERLAAFDLTLTLCYTPPELGVQPHHASPPRRQEAFAEFCIDVLNTLYPLHTRVKQGALSS
jgi:beta-xylosidase